MYPPKDTRIKQLLDAGFNIVDFVHFGIEKYDSNVARVFFNKYGSVSIRTFADDESKDYATPVQYEIESDNFDQAEKFCIEQNKNYHILMNQALKRADSVLWGNILWYDLSKFTVEYSTKPGTPRDIETSSIQDLRVLHGDVSEYIFLEREDRPLMEVITKTKLFLTSVRPIVIEFQLYPYAVGLLREKWVFWEWRRG